MKPKIILHLDMNSYFASAEQQANPFLRGQPVGVVATMTPNGCIIASSIEAKAKGIRTGLRIREARTIDPNVILIPNDSAKYRSCTENIVRILRDYTEDIEMYSIDEAFLNLTGFVGDFDQAEILGQTIRRRIKAEVGEWLGCSIGLAPTRWLAKFAGDTAPKGRTLVVEPANFSRTLDPRPLTDGWGIAHNLERRLHLLGLQTLGDLRRYSAIHLRQVFGWLGYELWANVNGIELPGCRTAAVPRSIGHQHVFAKRAQSLDYPKAVTAKLSAKTGRQLRRLGLTASGVWVWLDIAGGSRGGRRKKLAQPIVDSQEIFRRCWQLLITELPTGRLPNAVGVGVFDLRPPTQQLALWSPVDKVDKKDTAALAAALDAINDRYGDLTISRGSCFGLTARDAPDRVGFRKTVTVDPATGRYCW